MATCDYILFMLCMLTLESTGANQHLGISSLSIFPLVLNR